MRLALEMSEQHDVIIIGGGLAGLACAVRLCEQGRRVTLLEATDRVGGRVRTDRVEGFTLDHGFQVLLTAYPACQGLLDYRALRLRHFQPGALVRHGGKFATLADPWRRPSKALATVCSGVGSFADKLRIGLLRRECRKGSLQDLYERPATTTINRLQAAGFSQQMIDDFFRPFLGGVMLDESLSTSSRMFEFVFRMFSTGSVAVPAGGMGEIPRQLSERLPRGTLRLRSSVVELRYPLVRLSDGSEMRADQVVIATESSGAARLLGNEQIDTDWRAALTIYYAADRPPDHRKMLMLRGDETGCVQSCVILSNVAPQYAPADHALISVSVGDSDKTTELDIVDGKVRDQLSAWFGSDVFGWRRLRAYRIPFGLPVVELDPVLAAVDGRQIDAPEGVFVCGDHRETPSIQGALHSGIRVANAINRSR
jgi:phytoene dehydrogenase-like protein